ncbi:hypothetical protein [Halpernia sp. GG3]
MNRNLFKVLANPFWLIFITVVVKIPVFLTKHIQEDSFITWRVARNFLHYGVIGFNGDERISASTTHLYVLVSAFFQLIFGQHFIYPLLIFNGIFFAVGSLWLAKILFPDDKVRGGIFVIFLNMLPPALTASSLGMEYGILFFLYNGLMYFGIFNGKKWAYLIFPILLLWTRIDTVIFLGVFFLADLIIKKKINYLFVLGGLIGLGTVLSFNYFYFGEIVNHTITAKKIAYKNVMQNNRLAYFFYQWAYYGGLIKKYSLFTFLIFIAFLILLGFCIFKITRSKTQILFSTKIILVATVVFALLKLTVFAYFKAYFDWYYWLPRVFMLAVVLFCSLHFFKNKNKIILPILFCITLGLYAFQLLQSYTIGYMEETQRMQIAKDIESEHTDISKSIILEPAGKIPFYTGLYTYDEVGLVNEKITDEMLKDENFWWINSVKDFKPDYILTINNKPGDNASYYRMKPDEQVYFDSHYSFVKSYPIAEIHNNAPKILRWMYKIRPIGKDYFLYKIVSK